MCAYVHHACAAYPHPIHTPNIHTHNIRYPHPIYTHVINVHNIQHICGDIHNLGGRGPSQYDCDVRLQDVRLPFISMSISFPVISMSLSCECCNNTKHGPFRRHVDVRHRIVCGYTYQSVSLALPVVNNSRELTVES